MSPNVSWERLRMGFFFCVNVRGFSFLILATLRDWSS